MYILIISIKIKIFGKPKLSHILTIGYYFSKTPKKPG